MESRDYLEWFNYHTMCLPTVGAWFAKLDAPDAVQGAWMKALGSVDLKDACDATDAIVAGQIERPWPEETVAVVRKFAAERKLAIRNTESEPTSHLNRCELCRDTGHVTIWNRLVVRGVLQGVDVWHAKSGDRFSIVGKNGGVRALTAAVGCSCKLGERFGHWMRKKYDQWERVEIPRFNKSLFHCPVVFREWDEIKSMTTRRRIELDIEAAGMSAVGAVEWEF